MNQVQMKSAIRLEILSSNLLFCDIILKNVYLKNRIFMR